jgi:hypothetical protein
MKKPCIPTGAILPAAILCAGLLDVLLTLGFRNIWYANGNLDWSLDHLRGIIEERPDVFIFRVCLYLPTGLIGWFFYTLSKKPSVLRGTLKLLAIILLIGQVGLLGTLTFWDFDRIMNSTMSHQVAQEEGILLFADLVNFALACFVFPVILLLWMYVWYVELPTQADNPPQSSHTP